MIDLRLGSYVDVLGDVMADATIVDAPYGSKTHEGHDDATGGTAGRGVWKRPDGEVVAVSARRELGYASWSAADVDAFVAFMAPRTRGWLCSITSHDLAPAWTTALEAAGRYVFAPLPCYSPGSRARLAGDGPSSWTCWLVVSRTAEQHRWGTLPGGYVYPPERMEVVGGKPLGLMRAIVRDYSRPGDLVCDPCAGGATTLIAAAMEGRRAVGAELDPTTFAKAQARIAKGHTPDMFGGAA